MATPTFQTRSFSRVEPGTRAVAKLPGQFSRPCGRSLYFVRPGWTDLPERLQKLWQGQAPEAAPLPPAPPVPHPHPHPGEEQASAVFCGDSPNPRDPAVYRLDAAGHSPARRTAAPPRSPLRHARPERLRHATRLALALALALAAGGHRGCRAHRHSRGRRLRRARARVVRASLLFGHEGKRAPSRTRVTGFGTWPLVGYAMALDGGMVAMRRGCRRVDVGVDPVES